MAAEEDPTERFLEALEGEGITVNESGGYDLHLRRFDFSQVQDDAIVNHLVPVLEGRRGARHTTKVVLVRCGAGAAVAGRIAEALQRNTRLQILDLMLSDHSLVCPILERLATTSNTLALEELKLDMLESTNQASVAKALQQYLVSKHATIQTLQLGVLEFKPRSGSSEILDALSRNESVKELTFTLCSIGELVFDYEEGLDEDAIGAEEDAEAQALATFFQSKRDLTSLSIRYCNILEYPLVCAAVRKMLVAKEYHLRSLEIGEVSNAVFRALMAAVSRSTTLEDLAIRHIELDQHDQTRALVETIPSLKIKKVALIFKAEYIGLSDGQILSNEEMLQERRRRAAGEQDRFLAAFKRNYVVQDVQCLFDYNEECNWFTDANQARLDFYLNRNRQLAKWIDKPQLVPRHLWQYAMALALEAGVSSFYQCLITLSKEIDGLPTEVGSRKRKRKRKHQSDQHAGAS